MTKGPVLRPVRGPTRAPAAARVATPPQPTRSVPKAVYEADPEALLPLAEVERRSGLTRRSIYRAWKRRKFPGPVKFGFGNRVRWLRSEVDAWVAERAREGVAERNAKEARLAGK